MVSFFETHWTEWLVALRLPANDLPVDSADQLCLDRLKAQQLTALQACVDFHLKLFPQGSSVDFVCEELNAGRFYSIATRSKSWPWSDDDRIARKLPCSLFMDVLLAQGCWLEHDPSFRLCQLYRERFRELYYDNWSDWIDQEPNGMDYRIRHGNQFFERFCGSQPNKRKGNVPYVLDFIGETNMKVYLACLSKGAYTDFLSKSRQQINSESIENASTGEPTADFENDECCQRAAKKLISAIQGDAIGSLDNDEMSLLLLFLLDEAEPDQALARIVEVPEDHFHSQWNNLRIRIVSKFENSIQLHKHRCSCLKQFTRNHQSRSRCRCLAYMLHKEWYAATHQKLFRGRDQQMFTHFAQRCESLLNRQRP